MMGAIREASARLMALMKTGWLDHATALERVSFGKP
jgi:hypothetical protein